jgi:hypothetical protein
MPSLFVNCPTVICLPNMLFLTGEIPLVNCGPRSILLHRIQSTAILVFTILCKHHHPYYTSNPLLQQASEIDNLTVMLGQSNLVVLCRFHVGAEIPGVAPHYTLPPSTFNELLGSYWFDKPFFLTEGKLAAVRITPSFWGSQRTCSYTLSYHQDPKADGGGADQRCRRREEQKSRLVLWTTPPSDRLCWAHTGSLDSYWFGMCGVGRCQFGQLPNIYL